MLTPGSGAGFLEMKRNLLAPCRCRSRYCMDSRSCSAYAATVQQKSSPGRAGRRLRKGKDAWESRSLAVTQPAIHLFQPARQLFQQEIQWSHPEIQWSHPEIQWL